MANQVNKDAIVRFLTGYEDNLSEVDIENGTVYFALKPDPLNPLTKTIGSIYLDANNQRIMMSGESLATLDEVGDKILTKYIKGIDFDANSNAEATNNGAKGILTYVKGNGADVNVDVPSASASAAGFVTTRAQTFAGNKTFTGIVHLSNRTDASGASDSGVLIIGDKNGEHLIFDGNEIMSKNKTTGTGTLYLNNDGGRIQVGGSINPNSNKTLNLGSATNYWKEAYISNLITDTLSGHLIGSLTGNVTGNASSASKWLTARKVTMTGDVTGNFTLNGTQDVSYAASIANYSLKPVKLAVHDYANYSQLNRHTAASWGFSVDTTDANGAIYTMSTIARDKFISEEFPCSGGEKFIITYEISTSCKGNSTSGGTDSTYRGTAIGLYGYQKANKTTSAGIAYSTRVTGTADAPWTKVSSIVTTPTAARFFYVFVQTESWGNFSGSIRIRNLEVRRASGLDNAGDEILTKYLTRVAFTQENVSKKLNLQVYNGNNALKATVQVPNASTTEAGVVNTGTQSFAGNKTFKGDITIQHSTVDTMTNSSANPYLKFLDSDGSQGAMIMFTDYDAYRAPAGLKVLGVGAGTPAWLEVEGALIVGGATTLNGNLTLKGALTVDARATVDTLKISKTEMAKHIEFAREGFNYIATAANGCIAFLPNGASPEKDTSRLIVEDGGARPGATNTYNLGTPDNRWKNIYGNALNISGTSTLTGAVTLGGNLRVGGTLGVTGATTLESTLDVLGITKLKQGSAAISTTTGALQVTGGIATTSTSFFGNTIIMPNPMQMLRWTSSTTDNNTTGCSWYGIGTYTNSDSYNWLNISNYWGINITTRGHAYLLHNGNVLANTGNASGTVGSGVKPVYVSGGVIKASTSSVGGGTTPMYLFNGIMTSCDYGVGALHATDIFATDDKVYLLGTSSSSTGYRTTTYFDPEIYITTTPGELSCTRVVSRGNLYGGNNIYLRSGTQGVYARLFVETPGTSSTTDGIAGATGVTYMYLGNSKAVSTAAGYGFDNSCGVLRIYGSGTGYTDIRCGMIHDPSGEYTLYLPRGTGQIVYHTNDTQIGGPDTPVFVTFAGKVIPCRTKFTDCVLKAGDTMTGNLAIEKASGTTSFTTKRTDTGVSVTFGVGSDGTYRGVYDNSLGEWIIYSDGTGDAKTGLKLCGAVWNDYAEFRQTKDKVEPGRVVIETGRGDLKLSTERLQPGANVVSDTFGFAIGETKKAKTPLAVAGRVLVYTFEDKYSYKPGDAVCTGPNGTVSKMTREEIWKYPERIVGTVSEIPEYEIWESGDGPIQVNSRIWIKVK